MPLVFKRSSFLTSPSVLLPISIFIICIIRNLRVLPFYLLCTLSCCSPRLHQNWNWNWNWILKDGNGKLKIKYLQQQKLGFLSDLLNWEHQSPQCLCLKVQKKKKNHSQRRDLLSKALRIQQELGMKLDCFQTHSSPFQSA